MLRGGAAWLARMAHNHQVVGSNPTPATKIKYLSADRYFILVIFLLKRAQFTGSDSDCFAPTEECVRRAGNVCCG